MNNYIVIGASKGIGQALTNILIEKGHHVIALSRTKGTWGNPEQVTYIPFDVLSDNFNELDLNLEIHGLAYCPGSINLKPLKTIKKETLLEDLQINTLCAFEIIQQALPKFSKSSSCGIVLFSSVAVQLGMPFHASVGISKGALEGMVKSFAAELSPHIRVNAIAPSLTNTSLAAKFLNTEEKIKQSENRHPLKKIGTPELLAQSAYHLLVESEWTTGQILTVDGGISAIKPL